jgi:hypothetical protein
MTTKKKIVKKETHKEARSAPHEGPRTPKAEFVKVPAPSTDDLRQGFHGKKMNLGDKES